ncbi:MAG: DoxX family protein [Terracidiphilus sp.]
MNGLLWIAQILLAGVFLFTGVSKILAYDGLVKAVEAKSKGGRIGMSRQQAALVGIAELIGAVGVVVPMDLWPPYVLLRLAAAGLALLMVIAGIYHIRRQESAAPSVALFLLALFVIVGRWPR